MYPSHGRSSGIPRVMGVLKVKILEAFSMKLKWTFLGGGGMQYKKKLSVGVVWIFSGTEHHLSFIIILLQEMCLKIFLTWIHWTLMTP